TYSDIASTPSVLTRTISFTVSDGNNESAAATKTVTVTALPVVTTTAGSTNFTQGGAPVAVDVGVTVTDAGSTTLASATVSITGDFQSAEDVLAFTNQNGITGSYNAGTGVLTLSGTATLADYQTALQSITYADTSASPSTATRTVT